MLRHSFFRLAGAFLFLLVAAAAGAQSVTVGNVPPSTSFGFDPGSVTVVDLSTPANASGFLTTATFTWSTSPCSAAAKIKLFRRNGDNLEFIAERGPFDVAAFTQTVVLSPSIPVQTGDLIGISRVVECGSPAAQDQGNPLGLVAFGGDVTANVAISTGTVTLDATLAVQAQGTVSEPGPGNEALVGVIPVVTSSPGVPPSFFRTLVQLHNPGTEAIAGRLVYHAAGTSGDPSDPSFAYSLGPGQTQSIPDLLPAIGASGFGSVDVMSSAGPSPVVLVRLFNDAGAAGTQGSTEEVVLPGDALSAGDTGVLVGPADTTLFRFNIGVRALGSGAVLEFTARNAAGAVTRAFSKSYSPDYMEQTSAAALLGAPLGSNDTVTIRVESGSAVVYASTTDNRTNDPNHQPARLVGSTAQAQARFDRSSRRSR